MVRNMPCVPEQLNGPSLRCATLWCGREKGLIPLRSTIGGKCLRTAAFAYVAPCSSRHSCCALQRTCALDSLTLLGRIHHRPKIVAPLHVEPEVRAVAEDAGQDQGRRGG